MAGTRMTGESIESAERAANAVRSLSPLGLTWTQMLQCDSSDVAVRFDLERGNLA
jgi:hypothetical protein